MMDHNKFNLFLFDLIDHHIDEIETRDDYELTCYHLERIREMVGYLKKETIAKEPTEQQIIEYLAQ